MKFTGHPTHHGHHVNRITCSGPTHRRCSGFSGDGYDTYRCGCCCHDYDDELSEQERTIVRRLRGDA